MSQPRAPKEYGDQNDNTHEAKIEQRIFPTLNEDHVPEAGAEGDQDTSRPTGQSVGIIGKGEAGLVDRHCCDGEERSAQAEGRPGNQNCNDSRQRGCRKNRKPWSQTEIKIKSCDRICADREEYAVSERKLTAEAADNIPRTGESAEQISICENVDP